MKKHGPFLFETNANPPMPEVKPSKPEHSEPFDFSFSSDFKPYCKGCPNVDLDMNTTNLYADFALYAVGIKLSCKNAAQCEQLARHFKEG